MRYVYRALTVAFFLIALPYALLSMTKDAQTPERWSDINHNFPLEAVLLGVFVCCAVALAVMVWNGERKRRG